MDSNGYLTEIIYPDQGVAQWEYDILGRCILAKDVKGNIRKNSIDPLGRVIYINEPDENLLSFTYDGEGNILTARDRFKSVELEYGGMNRARARIQNDTRVEFLYDKNDNLTGVKNEHGLAYSFELNALGETLGITGFNGNRQIYTRDIKGRIESLTKAGGVVTGYSYDNMDRVSEITHSNGFFEKFTYQKNGDILTAQNQGSTVKFEYDALGRIIEEWSGEYWVASEYNNLDLRIGLSSSLGALQKVKHSVGGEVEEITHMGAIKNPKGNGKPALPGIWRAWNWDGCFPGM